MLGKLYKHELYSLFRTMLPVYAVLGVIALISRLSYIFDGSNILINTIQVFSTIFYIAGIVAIFIIGYAIVVVRFYKNLLSTEGYLTFTLPVKPSQHIVCKLVCGVIVVLANFVAVLASVAIFCVGSDNFNELIRALPELWERITQVVSGSSFILMAAEGIVFLIICIATSLLMLYTSMAIGQQFKSRIGGAVLSYICIYAAVQFIGLITIIPFFAANTYKIESFLNNNYTASVFIILSLLIVYELILSAVYFILTRYMLTKKLNLE